MRDEYIIRHDFINVLPLKITNFFPRLPLGWGLKIMQKFCLFKEWKILLQFLSRLSLQTLDHFNNETVSKLTRITKMNNKIFLARKIAHYRLNIFWVLWSVLVNFQREFMKHPIIISLMYHLLLILIQLFLFFSIVQFILFLRFASNN